MLNKLLRAEEGVQEGPGEEGPGQESQEEEITTRIC